HNAVAQSKQTTFTVDINNPVVENVTLSPIYGDAGDTISITADFSRAVTEPKTSDLGGNAIVWSGSDAQNQWTGSVVVPASTQGELHMPMTIAGFKDEVGNSGSAHTDTQLPLTPSIEINAIDDVNSDTITAVTISGKTSRFVDA
ncbi:hypothetical protein, partial [Vibrio mexicanus]|uniref:hypothetical protein n=1 Tax=Vibrio mexicanus TaxID=1004326 RepID=UPI00063C723E